MWLNLVVGWPGLLFGAVVWRNHRIRAAVLCAIPCFVALIALRLWLH